ncbi:MAG: type II toxin-antitoxin system HigB family toxin [Bryobacteraceae bacterium]
MDRSVADWGVESVQGSERSWFARRAGWNHLVDVRADFPHADSVGVFTVFNISGKKYRLISVIKYRWQIIYIRHILTHAEYDREQWKQ